MSSEKAEERPPVLKYCLAAATVMAYGWGYRGTVGHEAGAMVPAALLGLFVMLASGRLDWHRRAAVGGLFAAAGWAWGGSLSYMEQTFYVLSDSYWDVAYGYTMLFFLGALWAGIGGGVLGLAFTEPRSELEKLARVFTLNCAVFLMVHLFLLFTPDYKEALETLTVRHFHDGDWLPALLVLITSAVCWIAAPRDRRAAAIFFLGAVAWYAGYLSLTKFGGLRLGPMHRSESWGGVLGILVMLLITLYRRQNRASLMLSLYGVLGGGLAFSFAVFLRHPLVTQWGPFAGTHLPQWRFAEESFGFFMGTAIFLGVHRLLAGGLRPPEEDTPRAPLDVYAVFVVLVALLWINFRRHAAPWLKKFGEVPEHGLPGWSWYALAGALVTLPTLYVLQRYLRGDRTLAPSSAFGKGALVALLLLFGTLAGYAFHEPLSQASAIGHLIMWVPAFIAAILLLSFSGSAARAVVPVGATAAPDDRRWNVGVHYGLIWALAPVFLLTIAGLSVGMQDGSQEGLGRKRFGPDAYWRQTSRLEGAWNAVGHATELGGAITPVVDALVKQLTFDPFRNVTAILANGETSDAHRWFLKNQYVWLGWFGKDSANPQRAEIPLEFRGDRLYIALPSASGAQGYTVFEHASE